MTIATPKIITFGCRLNTYESEVMAAHASGAGLSDAIIVNTCAVTAEAERQARQEIRRLARDNPGTKIIVTGCAAQIHPDDFAAIDGVSHVIGNDLKLKAETWQNLGEKISVNDIMAVRETAPHMLQGFETRVRAFLQVQNGCDHRCTFCIIPYGRGPSRSVPLAQVVVTLRRKEIGSLGAPALGGEVGYRLLERSPRRRDFRLRPRCLRVRLVAAAGQLGVLSGQAVP